MSIADQAREQATACGGGRLPSEAVAALLHETDLEIEALMLELIPLASAFSSPVLSNFPVGAVAQGRSGALYFGANLEFAGCTLSQTVHAEQAAVVNAAVHGESSLQRLAASAAPCGHCRQFLFELEHADDLEIILAGTAARKLPEYLPRAFGPEDLNVKGSLLNPPHIALHFLDESSPKSPGAEAALDAAGFSYAPYSHAPAAAAITTHDGRVFAAPYLENAAFNPSLPPLQAALVAAVLAGHAPAEFSEVLVAQLEDSRIDHVHGARSVLASIAPQLTARELLLRT